jgi:hypothetical protein
MGLLFSGLGEMLTRSRRTVHEAIPVAGVGLLTECIVPSASDEVICILGGLV